MRRNRILRPLLSATLIAIAIAGCSRVRIVSHTDSHWQHKGLRTYAWKPAPPPLGDPRLDEKSLGVAIKKSSDATLAEMGYRLVTDQTPDFLMAYRLSLGEADRAPKGMDPATANDPGWLQFWENWEYEPNRDERALVMYAVDPKIHKMVWQGVGYVIVNFRASETTHRERVGKVVRDVLGEFPSAD